MANVTNRNRQVDPKLGAQTRRGAAKWRREDVVADELAAEAASMHGLASQVELPSRRWLEQALAEA